MLKRLGKRSGNRYTIISIIIIITMAYFFKLNFAGKEEGNYPQNIHYRDYNFEYSQTINESSYKFVRKYGANYEGYILLLRRGENWSTAPSKVYIFIGSKKYREYDLIE
jgi:hypothetical protein